MSNPGEVDKFASLIIPNCQPTASQEEKLQSCPLAPVSEVFSDGIVPSSSSSDDASEQATGIVMLTLPDSSDEYQTPPEYRSCSQNSSNDGQIPAIVDRKRESGDGEGVDVDSIADGDGDRHGGVRDSDDVGDGDREVMVADGRKTVDLGNEMDDLGFVESSSKVIEENDKPSVENNDYDTEPEPIEVECEVNETEAFKMGVIDSSNEIAHDVIVGMPEREQEATVSEMVVDADVNIRKRKLPFAIETKEKIDVQEDERCKHELFKDSLKRVLIFFVGEEKREVGDADVDFLETAKNRGMTFPRPQWWPPEGCED